MKRKFLLIIIISAAQLLLACSSQQTKVEPDISEIEGKLGIEILSLRLTSANYMLDFRYRIKDVEKATPFLERKLKPHVIVERSGRKLLIPVSGKLGPLRTSPKFVKVNKNYFVFFANPGRDVKSGDKVTVVIGEAKLEHLVVE
ncbi:MAG: hypothetical protein ACC707_16725 [Thiohalomonadales bacterium]